EPSGQRVAESTLRSIPHPSHISIGPNQYGPWRSDLSKRRKVPLTIVFGVDHLNPARPWCDVEVTRFAEIEKHWPCVVQQREDPQRTIASDQLKVGHAAPHQRVPLAQIVMNVQARHHRKVLRASLISLQQFGKHPAQGPG